MAERDPSLGYVPLVHVLRAVTVESVHFGSLIVVEASGRVRLVVGDPRVETFLRSSAKPLQSAALAAAGGVDRFGLDAEELAITVGSHSGEDRHVEVLRRLFRKIGVPESALQCGEHPPFHAPTRAREETAGRPFGAIRNNCSGKHAGMLALARILGAPLDGYLEPGHPVQVAILETIAGFAGLAPREIRVAVDGCGAPAHAMPLERAATAFARLLDPSGLSGRLPGASAAVVRAMRDHPYMIGGEGRLDTALIQAGRGAGLICKEGAEGFFAAAFLDRAGIPVGLALKVSDGAVHSRARGFLALEVLAAFGVLEELPPEVRASVLPEITNHAGKVVGSLARCADWRVRGAP